MKILATHLQALETLAASLTNIWLLSSVYPEVHFEVALESKLLHTVRAWQPVEGVRV